jgi:hypothetical protein
VLYDTCVEPPELPPPAASKIFTPDELHPVIKQYPETKPPAEDPMLPIGITLSGVPGPTELRKFAEYVAGAFHVEP